MFSIWHLLSWFFLLMGGIPAILVAILVRPKGPNRFGRQAVGSRVQMWDAFVEGFRKIIVLSGRARRSEFWSFIVAINLIIGLAGRIDQGLIVLAIWLICLVPILGISVRRLHDTNRSAWWLLLNTSLPGFITFLVLMGLPSQKDDPDHIANVF